MNPWIETAVVCALALLGVVFGQWSARLPGRFWTIGYFIPLGLILIYAVGTRHPEWCTHPPISWMMAGRTKFAIIGFIATAILTTPLSRLPQRRDRIFVIILMLAVTWQLSIWPFLAPAFNRSYLQSLVTNVDANGICLQSNDYNCGPAAAVTALRKLGLPAEEGQIAILAHTSSATGTPPDILAEELNRHYGPQGLIAEYRVFRDLSELEGAGLTLAVIKYSFMIDHFVVVLEVTPKKVVIGDPLDGRRVVAREDFAKLWRRSGVVLRRDRPVHESGLIRTNE